MLYELFGLTAFFWPLAFAGWWTARELRRASFVETTPMTLWHLVMLLALMLAGIVLRAPLASKFAMEADEFHNLIAFFPNGMHAPSALTMQEVLSHVVTSDMVGSNGPVWLLAIRLLSSVWAPTLDQIRWLHVVTNVLVAVPLFAAGRIMARPIVGLLMAGAWLLHPSALAYADLLRTYNASALLVAMLMVAVVAAQRNRRYALPLLMLTSLLLVWSFYGAAFLVAPVVALVAWQRRRQLRERLGLLALAIGLYNASYLAVALHTHREARSHWSGGMSLANWLQSLEMLSPSRELIGLALLCGVSVAALAWAWRGEPHRRLLPTASILAAISYTVIPLLMDVFTRQRTYLLVVPLVLMLPLWLPTRRTQLVAACLIAGWSCVGGLGLVWSFTAQPDAIYERLPAAERFSGWVTSQPFRPMRTIVVSDTSPTTTPLDTFEYRTPDELPMLLNANRWLFVFRDEGSLETDLRREMIPYIGLGRYGGYHGVMVFPRSKRTPASVP